MSVDVFTFLVPDNEFYGDTKNIIHCISHFYPDLSDGKYIAHRADGTTICEIMIHNKVLDGPQVFYHANGNIRLHKTIINNVHNGPYTSYHKNGNIWIQFTYDKGKVCGPRTRYYESGQIKEKSYYIQDIRNGFLMVWHENGILQDIRFYYHDQLIGYNEEVIKLKWAVNRIKKSYKMKRLKAIKEALEPYLYRDVLWTVCQYV